MQPQISIPTDNLYKFFALFGFSLVMVSLLGAIYISENTNQNILTYISEMDTIAEKGNVDISATYKVYEKLIIIAVDNKKTYLTGLGSVIGCGLLLMFLGFKRWYSYYQPLYDELLELNVVKLKSESSEHDL